MLDSKTKHTFSEMCRFISSIFKCTFTCVGGVPLLHIVCHSHRLPSYGIVYNSLCFDFCFVCFVAVGRLVCVRESECVHSFNSIASHRTAIRMNVMMLFDAVSLMRCLCLRVVCCVCINCVLCILLHTFERTNQREKEWKICIHSISIGGSTFYFYLSLL